MRERPDVCLYTESPEPSGVGTHMLALADRLRERYRLSFVCPAGGGGTALLGRAVDLGLTTPALDPPEEFAHFLARRPARLVHVHAGIAWEGQAGTRIARGSGARVLRTEHLPYLLTDPDQQAAYDEGLADVDVVLCVSEGVRRSYEAVGVEADRLAVVRNGIPIPDPVDGSDPGIRGVLGLATDAPLVLTIGRFTPQKGYDVLLDSVAGVLARVPGAVFLWIGDGPLRGDMEADVARLGLSNVVRLLGRRADIPALMNAADILVLPSRFEGLPLVVLEAFAAGLPVVATRVVGTDEAIDDGTTGRLVPAEDADALAVAIAGLLMDHDLSARLAEGARRDFDRRWCAGRMARETSHVYDQILASPPLS